LISLNLFHFNIIIVISVIVLTTKQRSPAVADKHTHASTSVARFI